MMRRVDIFKDTGKDTTAPPFLSMYAKTWENIQRRGRRVHPAAEQGVWMTQTRRGKKKTKRNYNENKKYMLVANCIGYSKTKGISRGMRFRQGGDASSSIIIEWY